MTVAELIEHLKRLNQSAVVQIFQYYETGDETSVTGILSNQKEVTLTDEDNS